MNRLVLVSTICTLGIVSPAAGQIPPGYEVVQITNTPLTEFFPDLNNRGQIAFAARRGSDNTTTEIFLYDDNSGEIIQITNNNVHDTVPHIGDDGTVAWSSLIGEGGTAEVMIRSPQGIVTRLTHNAESDGVWDVNSLGQVVFSRVNTRGCVGLGEHVMFYDGQTIRQITNNEWFNTFIGVNDRGDIVWEEDDICAGGVNWRSLIKLYSNGVVTTLSEPGLQAQYTSINNNGVCAWFFSDPATRLDGIQLWDNGVRTLFTNWGEAPHLNDRNDMAFFRWHAASSSWQVWRYSKGEFLQISTESSSNATPTINEKGEIAWTSGDFPEGDIWLLRRLPRGDLNCDGAFNGADIDLFFLALGSPNGYAAAQPNCDPLLGDMNADGALNGADIDPFFAALGGG